MLSNLQRYLVSSQAASVEDALVGPNIGHLCILCGGDPSWQQCWVMYARLAGFASYMSANLLRLQTFSVASFAWAMHSISTQLPPAAGPELCCH